MSDTAEEIRSVVRQLLAAHGCDMAIGAHVDVAVDAICGMLTERDLRIESLEAEGCVRLPDGRDVKVLGELPMTADGCVVGNHATLWAADPAETFCMRVDNIGCTDVAESDSFWEVGQLYSTREAAEAARKANA